MQKIIDALHQKYADMPNLRAREIRVDKQLRKVFCFLSHPNLTDVDKQRQSEIIAFVKTLVPQGYSAVVTLTNDHFTTQGFKRFLTDLLKSKYPFFAIIAKSMDILIDGNSVGVVFHVNSTMQTNIEVAELIPKLTDYLSNYTSYRISFNVSIDKENAVIAELSEQEKLVQLAVNRELLKPSRYFSVSEVTKHIGKPVIGAPMYISDIRKPSDSCVICGKVSAKTLKASKKDSTMYVCKFTLSDQSGGSINCIIFTRFEITDVKAIKENMGKTDNEAQTLSRTRTLANDRKMKKMMDVYDGMEVIVRGRIALNSFSEQLEMTVYDLSKCKIAPIGNAQHYNKPVANDYIVVRPEACQQFEQSSFVREISGKSLLSDKTYVILHANATGYNVVKDKFFALSAVKITDGHVVEQWFSYVNPEVDVPEEVLKTADVSTDKIVFYPTISELISDVYKFTYASPLIGTDLQRTLDLLNYYASPVGYRFTNECVQQSELLSNLFDNSIFVKKPNCSKLGDVARQCKVQCLSETFCKSTSNTLAKCLSVLANNVK